MTKAWGTNVSRESCIDSTEIAKFSQQRKQRQAENGEIVPVDLFEELYALAFQLIGPDTRQHFQAGARQVALDERL